MAFDVTKHANLGFIDRTQKERLEQLSVVHKRTLKAELEWLIDQAFKAEEITTPPISINK